MINLDSELIAEVETEADAEAAAEVQADQQIEIQAEADADLEVDSAANLLSEMDPEKNFFTYIEGVSKSAIELEKQAELQASKAQQSLVQAENKSQYLKAKR